MNGLVTATSRQISQSDAHLTVVAIAVIALLVTTLTALDVCRSTSARMSLIRLLEGVTIPLLVAFTLLASPRLVSMLTR